MANLTLTIDDELLRRARILALERGTSVNAIVREYLTEFAGRTDASETIEAFLQIGERSGASSGADGRTWVRDELYDR